MNTPPPVPQKCSLGIDENLAAVLCYVFGFVSGIAFLILEKENKFVRFHALQATLVFVFFTIIKLALSIIPILGGIVSLFILWPITVIVWLFLMYKAFYQEKFKFPVLGDIAEQQTL